MKFKKETKTKMFGNEKFEFEKCCTGNHDLKITEQRLRNDGYLVRTESINGKHYIYKKYKSLHKNYWGTTSQFWNRNPLLPKQVNALRSLTYDSDKDGKHDWEDCEPLNPKKQDVEGEFKTPEGNISFRKRYGSPKETPFVFKDETGKELYRTYGNEKIKKVSDTTDDEIDRVREEMRYGPPRSKVIESNGTPYYCESCHKEFLSYDRPTFTNTECPHCSSHNVIKMYNRV